MHPNLLIVALVLNVAVALYLKPWALVANKIGAVRGQRTINAYRVAGLLVVLVTVAHGQGSHGRPDTRRHIAIYETPLVAGVIRDGDYEEAREIAKANGIDVSKWNYEQVQYSRGDDALLQPETHESKDIIFIEKNWWKILLGVVVVFLLLQFGGGRESNDSDIEDMLDPEYRTGFVTDYHGDDAFEVPDGMHSQHRVVPVRSR
jgi:hypothetical protein